MIFQQRSALLGYKYMTYKTTARFKLFFVYRSSTENKIILVSGSSSNYQFFAILIFKFWSQKILLHIMQ
jgi:hypothetical protein